MSRFLFKAVILRASSRCSPQNRNFTSLGLRWFSVSSEYDRKNSFVVSYLEDTLGFSPENAFSASKYVKFESSYKPDRTMKFFRSFGFNLTQISKLVRGFPGVLIADTEKTILPKLEFLKAKGVSNSEMAKMLPCFPDYLKASLAHKIIPSYDYLRNLFQCDKRTIYAVKQYPDIICLHSKDVIANINVLREHGMPNANIALLLERYPRPFVSNSDRFRETVEEVTKMGFKASKANFANALRVYLQLSKSKWESKVKLYCKCGFSEEEVSKLFRGFPNSMSYSEQKILATVGFFVEEMHWKPSLIAKYSWVIGMSLKKRIIPRCSVFKAPLWKGLVNENKDIPHLMLKITEEKFMEKFVKDSSKLLELYKEKLLL